MRLASLADYRSLLGSRYGDRAARGFSVTLELAFRCNVRCVFCSRWNDPVDLDLSAIETVAEDMAALGAAYVSLTGGDPFVRKDITAIIDAFASRRVPVHINTNGVLLRRYADFLRSRAGSLVGITVSIDSPHAHVHDEIRGVEGTFRKALDGMERLRDVIDFDLACTLNRRNMDEIEEYAAFAREHGYTFRFQPLHDDGDNQLAPHEEGVRVEEDGLAGLTARLQGTLGPDATFAKARYYDLFEPFFRDRQGMSGMRCTAAARLIYFVDPNGEVFPCDTRRDVSLGNVYRTRFADIVRGGASTAWRRTCRQRENGCWCMYACVAPNNVRNMDLPLVPVGRRGWPVRRRWRRRTAALAENAALPEPRRPAEDPAPWPRVAAVMASYNGGPLLVDAVRAALALDYPRDLFSLVLVDDGSSDGSVDAVREACAEALSAGTLTVVRNPRPTGVAAAYNRGVLAADPRARFYLKLDGDLLAEPGALRALVAAAAANSRAGILGGRVYLHDRPEEVHFLGGDLGRSLRGPALPLTPPDLPRDASGRPRWLDVINSCMALIRREVFERAGLYPERYGRYEYEDYDLAFRARAVGFGSLYCPAAVGYHAVSLTSRANALGPVRARLRARNGVLFTAAHRSRRHAVAFALYHLAKAPLDALRRGDSFAGLVAGSLAGLAAAFRRPPAPRRLTAAPPRPSALPVLPQAATPQPR